MDVLVIVERQAKLREPSARTGSRFAHVLNGRKEQPQQDGDNRDDDEQLGEGETVSAHVSISAQACCYTPSALSVPLRFPMLHDCHAHSGKSPMGAGECYNSPE